ncbi:MAG: NUDIX hydrolase [Lachnospiraceae bacterium]|nr:NUDIX hydrolase [Ruminococcus sp.]MCM1274680.1 NUDIX hydrolase [Lachnospiraceae bacterium]
MHLNEKTLESEQKFDGRIVKLFVDKAELENGETVTREVIKHPGGVCVVPLDGEGNVLFVRQFRYPHQKVLPEIPAGKLEYGEDHRACGLRELKEETGCTCDSFEYLGCLIPTPAYDTEVIHMYLARGLHYGAQSLDEDEFLEVEKIPLEKAVEMIMNNEIHDAKTQIAVLKTKLLLNE